MFKVVIIDDEPIVRKGIINIIDWASLGCQVVSEASNGLEGMEIIRQYKPDIILTDINMPEIDGLEMIRNTLDIIPWSKIIILTGYREFDYIQEALKLGASEFLLKPSKIDEITTAVKKACLELEYKNRRDENIQALKDHYDRSLPLLKEKLLFDIVFSTALNEKEIEEELELYGMHIDSFVMVSVDISHEKPIDIYQKQLFKIGIKNAFVDIFKDLYLCETIHVTQSRMTFVLQSKSSLQDFTDDVSKKAESFQVLIKSCFDLNMSLAISTQGNGFRQLSSKMKECEQALSYKLYFGEDALILYDDIKTLSFDREDDSLKTISEDILSAIKIGNEHLLDELNKKLYPLIEKTDYQSKFSDLVASIKQVSIDQVHDFNDRDFKTCIKIYESIASDYRQEAKNSHLNNLSQILKQSLEYIHNNYQDSISLQDVADYTYVSIYYLSRMFKKEIGKNFVDYLNEYRIQKSYHYLKDYELKTYEVAELVGISDPHYFSKLFKKYTGQTPTEYRNKL
ncbi:response regulator [Acidaminobacter sp. JC074]|uniref:response regulator n=1 Tax=Acidaminobacter sp. JC074 TaxID=2530199 RepID=UPI001F0E036A|nr:response regulator [Acidaminobacter sp. JC074]MCH4886192.1 response regulator [Acidaminobacter sp. JC074]